MGDTDPMNNMRFYTKSDQRNGVELSDDQTSMFLPRRFSEQRVRVYCKKIDEDSLSKACRRMDAWWETKKQAEVRRLLNLLNIA
ncbi:Deoxynucleoside triphosphate triphosphohydrolase SAMHD1 [Liparis tanakae]|uniref:Deoxynucleoside triphosphate triphosphohydrolase SAMHD1 n=1 Tax=Liparis tanakae TaxID=230148 RepID=A0A4Z2EEL7_9TELE|nr:Deoxynucleoside triphosphate triphosphohydrolase SAMHD1 [Liparis tanakae]